MPNCWNLLWDQSFVSILNKGEIIRMKRYLFVSLLPLLIFTILTACNTNDEGVATIDVFHYKVEISDEWEELVQDFESENPNIKVESHLVGGGADWQTNLQTRFASGDGPDVFVVDGQTMLEQYQNQLVDLSDEPWVDDAYQSALDVSSIDSKILGAPYQLSGYGLVYNKDMFDEAGITKIPETITELREAAEKLDKIGITPFGNAYGEWWVLGQQQFNVAFAQQEDPEKFMKDLTNGEVSLAENKVFSDYKDFLDLTLEYGNDNAIATDAEMQNNLFASEDVAMIHQGYWIRPTIKKTNDDINMGMFPVPVNDDAKNNNRLPVAPSFSFVVNKDSEYIDESKLFIDWLVSSETGTDYMTNVFGFIPAYDHIEFNDPDPLAEVVMDYSSQDKTIPWSFSEWPNGSYDEFFAINQGYIGHQYDYDEMLEKIEEAWIELSSN